MSETMARTTGVHISVASHDDLRIGALIEQAGYDYRVIGVRSMDRFAEPGDTIITCIAYLTLAGLPAGEGDIYRSIVTTRWTQIRWESAGHGIAFFIGDQRGTVI